MTRVELVDWLKANGCEQVLIEGVNHTGRAIKFYHPVTKKHSYIDLPFDDRQVPDYIVAHTCDQLLIESPDCVSHQKGIVNEIKNHLGKSGH